MTRQQALEISKRQADTWYKQYKLKHRTSEAIERGRRLNEKYGTVVVR